MSVWLNKYITVTDENRKVSSQFSNVVFGMPNVSTFMDDEQGSVLFKRFRIGVNLSNIDKFSYS